MTHFYLMRIYADYVEAQLLSHTKKVMFEACLQASSASLMESTALEADCGDRSSSETLDAVLSDCLLKAQKRFFVMDTDPSKNHLLTINLQELLLGGEEMQHAVKENLGINLHELAEVEEDTNKIDLVVEGVCSMTSRKLQNCLFRLDVFRQSRLEYTPSL